jgi:transcriptional regulator with XRE-family HTH domain
MAKPIATSHFHLTLKAERERRGWSQRQLAEMADTSQSHICDLEGGAHSVTLGVLRRWAACFDWQVALIEKEH